MLTLGIAITVIPMVQEDVEALKALATSYAANRSLLSYGSIEISSAMGRAPTPEAARAGQWSVRREATGRYVFDGPRAYFETVFSLEQMKASRRKVGEGRYTTTLLSRRVLTDGRITLSDRICLNDAGDQLIRAAQIDAGTRIFYMYYSCPLNLGEADSKSFDLSYDIDRCLNANMYTWSLKDDAFEGAPVIRLTLRSGDFQRQYWIDVERGSIPREIRDQSGTGEPSMRIYYDDLRPVGCGAWLPFKMTVFFRDGEAKQLTIRQAEFGSRPPPSAFRMEFDEPEALINTADMVHYKPRKVWDLAELPSVSSGDAHRIILEDVPPPPVMRGHDEGGTWSDLLIPSGCLVALGVGVYFVYRRYHA
ncbi:MAG: hypothetical protein KatS3mg108_0185 [Isosphaeraceae bacterium]|jgi:hypothetical protein|nr:MAG: hypothetical protein KatS3mg108_0185 [Isosphaeraceae bacterium]